MRRTFKYRIYPTKAQVLALEQQLFECCFFYINEAKRRELIPANGTYDLPIETKVT
ncbi:MAG TPA: helix-turn-helix domain-containing protein [Pyrinomonadaceae bacterium]